LADLGVQFLDLGSGIFSTAAVFPEKDATIPSLA